MEEVTRLGTNSPLCKPVLRYRYRFDVRSKNVRTVPPPFTEMSILSLAIRLIRPPSLVYPSSDCVREMSKSPVARSTARIPMSIDWLLHSSIGRPDKNVFNRKTNDFASQTRRIVPVFLFTRKSVGSICSIDLSIFIYRLFIDLFICRSKTTYAISRIPSIKVISRVDYY